MLFFDTISVNQFFLEDRVKIMLLLFLASSDIRRCKLLTSCKKMNHPGVNRFDDLILWYVLTTRTKMWMMRQSYNGIDRINFRAKVK